MHPKFQIIGTSSEDLHDPISKVLQKKGIEHGIVVTSNDGIDEFSITDTSKVTEIKRGEIKKWTFDPESYGIKCDNLAEIQCNTGEEAYLLGVDVLNGKRCAASEMVAINSGVALYMLNLVETINDGIIKSKSILNSGRTLLLLNRFATLSKSWMS